MAMATTLSVILQSPSTVPRISCSDRGSLKWPPQPACSLCPIPSSVAVCGQTMLRASVAVALGSALLFLPPLPSLADFLSYDHADMRGADLSGKDLKGAVFAACDCRRINLESSNLDGSTVTFAGFQGANLQNTSWVRSLADRVVFREANLKNANFTNAILSGSQFDGADITGADFTEAIVDKSQRLKMCKKAEGTNPVTGVETRESLFC